MQLCLCMQATACLCMLPCQSRVYLWLSIGGIQVFGDLLHPDVHDNWLLGHVTDAGALYYANCATRSVPSLISYANGAR